MKTRLEKIRDLKYPVQEIMINSREGSEEIYQFTSKLDENTKAQRITLSNLLYVFFDFYSAKTKIINVTTLKINVII